MLYHLKLTLFLGVANSCIKNTAAKVENSHGNVFS